MKTGKRTSAAVLKVIILEAFVGESFRGVIVDILCKADAMQNVISQEYRKYKQRHTYL